MKMPDFVWAFGFKLFLPSSLLFLFFPFPFSPSLPPEGIEEKEKEKANKNWQKDDRCLPGANWTC